MEEEMEKVKFGLPSIGIPGEVLFNSHLTLTDKVLFGFIRNLSKSKSGCWASNRYLGELIGVRPQTISLSVSKLKKYGYITVKFEEKKLTKETIRRIYENPEYPKIYENLVKLFHEIYVEHKDEAKRDLDTLLSEIKGGIIEIIGGYYLDNNKGDIEGDKERDSLLLLKDKSFNKEESCQKSKTSLSLESSSSSLRLRKRKSKDPEYQVFLKWQSMGKPLTKHKVNSQVTLRGVKEAKKKLKGCSVDDICLKIETYYNLLVSPDSLLNPNVPGHVVGFEEFFHINDYNRNRMIKNGTDLKVESWFDECDPDKDPSSKFLNPKREILNGFPAVTETIREIYVEKVLGGVKPRHWNNREESGFRMAGNRLVKFFRDMDGKVFLTEEERRFPALLVPYIFSALDKELKGNFSLVTPGWLCSDTTFNRRLPAYLYEQAMITNQED